MRAQLVLCLVVAGCTRPVDRAPPEPPVEPIATSNALPAPPPAVSPPAYDYPWLPPSRQPRSPLVGRFDPPPGFTRVELRTTSFGAWLRSLPLEPPGTPVKSYRGDVVLPADHENLAAVVAIDVGDQDLQQCADSIIRLHAEWLYARSLPDASYRSASGAEMPFLRWARGERMVPDGMGFKWTASGRPDLSHASYRRWLDRVFAFANTGSLARDGEKVAAEDLRPGDFVVQPGGPGHAVLVLDMARAPDGRRALLLGQGFMPAQSFHVLRPSRRGAWFVVEPHAETLETPFWRPFSWTLLRRFKGT